MTDVPIAYAPRSEAEQETELNSLAAVYRFVLDCHAKKKATRTGGHEDAKGGSSDPGAKASIP